MKNLFGFLTLLAFRHHVGRPFLCPVGGPAGCCDLPIQAVHNWRCTLRAFIVGGERHS